MATLEPIADEVWSTTIPLRFWGVETGTRMTIVRLQSGGLFVHSPIPLVGDLPAEVGALGPVTAVVAPSLFHHMSVRPWKEAYPDAIYCCTPGLDEKREDFAWDRVLSDEAEPEWAGELEQVYFSARSLENETVFFHPSTRTMICADTIFNLATHPRRFTRFVAFILATRKPGATWLERVMMRDRVRAREQVGRMLAWKPERILLAHGAPILEDGEAVLRDAYAWL